tara:strand:- start:78 stop:665 length:588 start_codon:yes stop_codon:yes gene_type:complete
MGGDVVHLLQTWGWKSVLRGAAIAAASDASVQCGLVFAQRCVHRRCWPLDLNAQRLLAMALYGGFCYGLFAPAPVAEALARLFALLAGADEGGPALARVRTNPAFAKFVAVNVDVWVLGLCVPWNMLVSRLGRRDAALRPRPVHWLPAPPKFALVGAVLASYHLLPVDEGDGDAAMDIVLDFLFRCLVSWFAYPD